MRSISAAIMALVLMYVAVNGKNLGFQIVGRSLFFTWSCILLFGSLIFMLFGI